MRYLEVPTAKRWSAIGLGTWQFGSREWGYGGEYADGSGGEASRIVARALERLVLVSKGVDAKSLVVPEAGHLAHRAAYESNLRAYSDGGPRGVHAWAIYGAEAFAAGAEASPLRG